MNTRDIVTAILTAKSISPDAANTMIATVAKNPAMFTALLSDLTDEDRGVIVSAIVAAPRWTAGTVTNTPPAPPPPEGTMRDKILVYLRSHPRSNAGAMKLALFPSASGGGLAAALKVGIDKGQIVAFESTAEHPGKTYSLTEVYLRSIGG